VAQSFRITQVTYYLILSKYPSSIPKVALIPVAAEVVVPAPLIVVDALVACNLISGEKQYNPRSASPLCRVLMVKVVLLRTWRIC
jgi:hypothetical protein